MESLLGRSIQDSTLVKVIHVSLFGYPILRNRKQKEDKDDRKKK